RYTPTTQRSPQHPYGRTRTAARRADRTAATPRRTTPSSAPAAARDDDLVVKIVFDQRWSASRPSASGFHASLAAPLDRGAGGRSRRAAPRTRDRHRGTADDAAAHGHSPSVSPGRSPR